MILNAPVSANRTTGFSLIELILVLVLLGILAAIAVPRFAGTSAAFQQAAFTQQLTSAVRYAQQTAVAQNRPVSVVFSAEGFAITFADNNTPLRNPADGKPFNTQAGNPGQAPDGLGFTGNATFTFDGLGRPWQGSDLLASPLTVGINDKTLQLEPQTGYFHAP